jgi:putative addiction module component (TIGR02574 family)
MSLNIDDIKKLPDQEKLKLIDEILESIDEEIIDEHLRETKEDNILRERWEKYKSGNIQFDSWENVEKRLREKASGRK